MIPRGKCWKEHRRGDIYKAARFSQSDRAEPRRPPINLG
ncbi:unnamed protein product [Ciceribacter selenitireducens ATCC BAA-1503]|uniref:Uncharacterized protein n=1 Tax=Ciceribacter selenitireducens ATCC BAA-1503 TaxID=1336235 RepID=A0A376AFM4_9HYPH|nr:unnamed protein product [Ciceribacter selenitireducens ATCC BAA-1503]